MKGGDPKLRIDRARCVRCGRCLKDCASEALVWGADGFPAVAAEGEERCIRCQHCLAICPAGALSILGRTPGDCAANAELPTAEQMLSLIRSRRTCRSYRRESLPPETLKKLKSMLAWAPTGVNDHRTFFAFVEDAAVMESIRTEVSSRLRDLAERKPEEVAAFGRYKRGILAGEDIVFRGAPHLVVAASPDDAPCAGVDPVIALSYFELYAQSLGLGTTWCGLAVAALKRFGDIAARFRIPAGYSIGYAMLFGPTGLHYPRATRPDPVRCETVRG